MWKILVRGVAVSLVVSKGYVAVVPVRVMLAQHLLKVVRMDVCMLTEVLSPNAVATADPIRFGDAREYLGNSSGVSGCAVASDKQDAGARRTSSDDGQNSFRTTYERRLREVPSEEAQSKSEKTDSGAQRTEEKPAEHEKGEDTQGVAQPESQAEKNKAGDRTGNTADAKGKSVNTPAKGEKTGSPKGYLAKSEIDEAPQIEAGKADQAGSAENAPSGVENKGSNVQHEAVQHKPLQTKQSSVTDESLTNSQPESSHEARKMPGSRQSNAAVDYKKAKEAEASSEGGKVPVQGRETSESVVSTADKQLQAKPVAGNDDIGRDTAQVSAGDKVQAGNGKNGSDQGENGGTDSTESEGLVSDKKMQRGLEELATQKNVPRETHASVQVSPKPQADSKTTADSGIEQGPTVNADPSPPVQRPMSSPAAGKTVDPGAVQAESSKVLEQVQESFSASVRQGGQEITIRLNPPELGSVRISIKEQGEQISGMLEVSEMQTRAEIQQNLPTILRNLQDMGIQVKRLDVSLNTDQGQQSSLGQSSDANQGEGSPSEESNTDGSADPHFNPRGTGDAMSGFAAYSGERGGYQPLVTDTAINMLV